MTQQPKKDVWQPYSLIFMKFVTAEGTTKFTKGHTAESFKR